MKLLFIIPNSFIPANNGPKNVIFNLIKFFSRNSICDLAILCDPTEDKKKLTKDIYSEFPDVNQVYLFYKQRSSSFINKLSNQLKTISQGYQSAISLHESQEFLDWINQKLPQQDYDLIHFDMFYVSKYQKYFAQYPTVLVPHDAYSYKLETLKIKRLRDLKNYIQMKSFRLMETTKYQNFSCVCPVSQQDANFLKKINPQINITSAPIAVSPKYIQAPKYIKTSVKPKILFSGSGSAPIGAREVRKFVQTNCDRILEKIPTADITLLGKYKTPDLMKFINDRQQINLVEYAEDYLGFLQQDWVYVYPQNWGSGLKTKVQQAMALGLPIVGNKNAFSGLDVIHGEHCFICETPEEFIDAIDLLFNDANLRQKIGNQAHELIRDNYSVNAVGAKMSSIYAKVMEQF